MNKINFNITSSQIISKEFLKRNAFDFSSALTLIRQLPYGRNVDKKKLETVFMDGYGTCSTKHALLRQLAIENNCAEVKLIIGLFRMNKVNTPEIKSSLVKAKLEYIPEAHCYLKVNGEIIDVTKSNSNPEVFINDLIKEIEIQPNEIAAFKINYHKNYLKNWLIENSDIQYSIDELWEIREQCIKDLETNPTQNNLE